MTKEQFDYPVDVFKRAVAELFRRRRVEGPLSDIEEARIAAVHEALWEAVPESARGELESWIDEQKTIRIDPNEDDEDDLTRLTRIREIIEGPGPTAVIAHRMLDGDVHVAWHLRVLPHWSACNVLIGEPGVWNWHVQQPELPMDEAGLVRAFRLWTRARFGVSPDVTLTIWVGGSQ